MILLLLFLSVTTCTAFHTDNIQGVSVIKDNFPTSQANVEFGTGYNTVNLQRTYNSAVHVTKGLQRGGYIECTYRIKLCKSREEFLSSFSGGVSASGSYMGVEGSASVRFLSETKITSLDSVLVASVEAITDTEIATQARYTEQGQTLLDDGDFAKFVRSYGTHYLRKIILGGKMLLVMKFSSKSLEDKQELDTKLKATTGTFAAEAEFAAKMHEISESSSLEVSLYASGSNTEPPKPEVQACIQYAIDFAKSVLEFSTVREIEYAAVWTIPGTPDSFKRFLFPLQARTDQLVEISVNLLDVNSKLTDMLAQRDSDLSFFTSQAWEKLSELRNEVKSLRTELQRNFQTSHMELDELSALIKAYSGRGELILQKSEEIAAVEREMGNSFVLRSGRGGRKYISTDVAGYPRLDSRAPVPLKFEDRTENTVTFKGGHVLVRNLKDSRILCMGKNKWYVFWDSGHYWSDSKCQWRLAHATDVNKVTLEYGDRVILYNKYWPHYIMGVDEAEERWISCIRDLAAGDRLNQWVLEKSQ